MAYVQCEKIGKIATIWIILKKDFKLRMSFQDYKDLNDIVKHIKDNKISDLALLLVLNKFVFYCFLIFCISLNFVCFIICPLLIIELNDL